MISVKNFISSRVESANISCKTLVMTVFGDTISQHGGWVWLGSLIETMAGVGYSERLVRTSVYRLVKEDWLQVKKIGRKSYYAFTDSAHNQYVKAARRIYSIDRNEDGENWLVVIPSFVPENKLSTFKRQLKWLGFSSLSSGVYAHPFFEQESLEDTIKELDLTDSVIVFSSRTIDENSSQVLKKLVFEKWELEDLQNKYDRFIDTYQFMLKNMLDGKNEQKNLTQLTNEDSFLLRTLLIHEYRRVLLNDHDLPAAMLPREWNGHKANEIVKTLYSMLSSQSCLYITSTFQSMTGLLPEVSDEFKLRFNSKF